MKNILTLIFKTFQIILSFIFIGIVVLVNLPFLVVFQLIGGRKPFERFIEFLDEII